MFCFFYLSNAFFECCLQLSVIDRLQKIGLAANVHCLSGITEAAVSRSNDRVAGESLIGKLLAQLQTCPAQEVDIYQEDIRPVCTHNFHCLFAACSFADIGKFRKVSCNH